MTAGEASGTVKNLTAKLMALRRGLRVVLKKKSGDF